MLFTYAVLSLSLLFPSSPIGRKALAASYGTKKEEVLGALERKRVGKGGQGSGREGRGKHA